MKFTRLIQEVLQNQYKYTKEYTGNIVIVGGIHGDEQAGNIAANSYKNTPGIIVINNINTTGHRRLNGKDFNRHFDKNDSSKLNNSILERIVECNPTIVIDLHEDVDARGVYAYCSKDLSEKVKDILQQYKLPLAKTACGDKVTKGVVDKGHLPTKGTLEKACSIRNIPYCTFETPTSWPLKERVRVLKLLVDSILSDY